MCKTTPCLTETTRARSHAGRQSLSFLFAVLPIRGAFRPLSFLFFLLHSFLWEAHMSLCGAFEDLPRSTESPSFFWSYQKVGAPPLGPSPERCRKTSAAPVRHWCPLATKLLIPKCLPETVRRREDKRDSRRHGQSAVVRHQ